MKKWLPVLLLSVIGTFAQYDTVVNARGSALGGHLLGKTSLVNDASDIINFPAEVTQSTDMAQASATVTATPAVYSNGTVFATKDVTDKYSLGIVFAQQSIVGQAFADNAIEPAINLVQNNTNASVTPPANAGHFLFGFKPSKSLGLAIDLFREASNSSYETSINGRDSSGYVDCGALGAKLGADFEISDIGIKAVVGYVSLNYESEDKTPTATVKIETSKGFALPVALKATKAFGSHHFTVGADLFLSSFQLERSPTINNTPKSSTYSAFNFATGILDEIKIAENTKVFASVVYNRQAQSVTPANIDSTHHDSTYATIIAPTTSVGVEQVIPNVWKFDRIILRAGGSKKYYWNTQYAEGGKYEASNSELPTSDAFSWTTGVGFEVGKFTLDLTISPETWNGVYFISGAGPKGGVVTMTYAY